MSALSQPTVLLTVRGKVIPTEPDAARDLHDQTAGSPRVLPVRGRSVISATRFTRHFPGLRVPQRTRSFSSMSGRTPRASARSSRILRSNRARRCCSPSARP